MAVPSWCSDWSRAVLIYYHRHGSLLASPRSKRAPQPARQLNKKAVYIVIKLNSAIKTVEKTLRRLETTIFLRIEMDINKKDANSSPLAPSLLWSIINSNSNTFGIDFYPFLLASFTPVTSYPLGSVSALGRLFCNFLGFFLSSFTASSPL